MRIKTGIRWAVVAGDQGRILQLPGITQHIITDLPQEGEIIIHPHLVDPATRHPCQLMVIEVRYNPRTREYAVVVSRLQ